MWEIESAGDWEVHRGYGVNGAIEISEPERKKVGGAVSANVLRSEVDSFADTFGEVASRQRRFNQKLIRILDSYDLSTEDVRSLFKAMTGDALGRVGSDQVNEIRDMWLKCAEKASVETAKAVADAALSKGFWSEVPVTACSHDAVETAIPSQDHWHKLDGMHILRVSQQGSRPTYAYAVGRDKLYFADAQDPQAKRSIFDKYADMQRQVYEAGQLAQQLVTAQNRIAELQRRIDELTAPAKPVAEATYLHAALRNTGNL